MKFKRLKICLVLLILVSALGERVVEANDEEQGDNQVWFDRQE